MKPVNVTFPLDPEIDHNARLSMPKEMEDNHTFIENDADGRKRKVRVCRSNKKSPPKQKKKEKSADKEIADKSSCKSPTRKKVKSQKISISQKPEESSSFSEIDWKHLPSPEYINVPVTDSDSSQEDDKTLTDTSKEFTENITLTEKTVQDGEENQRNDEIIDGDKTDPWTKEEDRIILETYKQNFSKDPINLIKQRLPNRTNEDINSRFDYLMNLLLEMYSRGNPKISNS